MKNTVKKILALVFVVAMVCSLAVPAFAAEIAVNVTVVNYNGEHQTVTVKLGQTAPTVEDALEATVGKLGAAYAVTVKSSTGKVTSVGGVEVTDENNVFGTAAWTVALNGKVQNVDLDTVAVEKNDEIVVYWADAKFGTKLAQIDDSAIAQGIVSFYYFDAEGNKKPLTGAKVTLTGNVKDQLNVVNADETNSVGDYLESAYSDTFVTDEKGQIWLAPEYLDHEAVYAVATLTVDALKAVKKSDGYTDAEVVFYNKNLNRNLVNAAVIDYEIEVDGDLYDVAGATGDMTIVYVLVAAAAVVTLAAVVVMKKKSVKAN